MATGFYPQKERNGWRYQFGTSYTYNITAWRNLFHLKSNLGYSETSKILVNLLSTCEEFTNDILIAVADKYIADCEAEQSFDFRYYYIKYRAFRPGSYGKYWNDDYKAKPYLFSVMKTASHVSENTYVPYFKVADAEHISRDDKGQRLVYRDKYIVCKNDSYLVRSTSDNSDIDIIAIPQNESGIDSEDRIEILKNYLSANMFA